MILGLETVNNARIFSSAFPYTAEYSQQLWERNQGSVKFSRYSIYTSPYYFLYSNKFLP